MKMYSFKIYSDSDILDDGVVSIDDLKRVFDSYLFNLRYFATGFSVSEVDVPDLNLEPRVVFSDDDLPF